MKPSETLPYGDKLDNSDEERVPFFAAATGKTLSAVLMVAIVILVLTIGSDRGEIAYEMDKTQLAVTCLDWEPRFIPYATIKQVQLLERFSLGETVRADDWNEGWCGTYCNEEFGVYTLYAYSSGGAYIVVEYEGGVLVFNARTKETTCQVWEALLKRWEARP